MNVIPSRSSTDWIRTIYASDAIWQLSKYRRELQIKKYTARQISLINSELLQGTGLSHSYKITSWYRRHMEWYQLVNH
jgi:hypothetical protein